LWVVNIGLLFGEFTTPLRHILQILNITLNRNNFFLWKSAVHSPFVFSNCLTEHTSHLARLWIRAATSKSRFYHCQMSMAHR
jgi:hypothetical protein